MRVICPIRIFDTDGPLSDALLQVNDKVYINTKIGNYYIIFVPFELNILYSQLIFRSKDLDITIDIKPVVWHGTAGTLNIILSLFGLTPKPDTREINIHNLVNYDFTFVRINRDYIGNDATATINGAILDPWDDVRSIHVIVRKNNIKVADIGFTNNCLGYVIAHICKRGLKVKSELRDFADIGESEIYINFVSDLMDIGGERNYEVRDSEDMVRQLEQAKSGIHPCPTALRGVGIVRTKSAR